MNKTLFMYGALEVSFLAFSVLALHTALWKDASGGLKVSIQYHQLSGFGVHTGDKLNTNALDSNNTMIEKNTHQAGRYILEY